ncbi:MAG: zf-HC2 domain-containing protein [Acidobacteria bacterium]|nr:zf-HC2 domain-containing protein [Acidobacteriota bacterium]
MKCEELRSDLALYGDGFLPIERSAVIETHFESCPVCRAKNAANLEIVSDLRQSEKPRISADLQRSLRMAVASELNSRRRPASFFSHGFGEWLQMRVMPYAVGVAASTVIGIGVLTFLLSNIQSPESAMAKPSSSRQTGLLLAGNQDPYAGTGSEPIYPAEYARNRLAVSGESPSLNPQGALVAMTSSLLRENRGNDGVVVVADVLSNGVAQIKEVISPTYNSRTISDLEKAMDAELGNAPFVPASLDNRSDSVRVVLRFQRVDVNTRENVKRRR